jgi:hypothetical protein
MLGFGTQPFGHIRYVKFSSPNAAPQRRFYVTRRPKAEKEELPGNSPNLAAMLVLSVRLVYNQVDCTDEGFLNQ